MHFALSFPSSTAYIPRETDTVSVNSGLTASDLVNRVKSCLNSLGSKPNPVFVPPSIEVVEQSVAFLINIKEWSTLWGYQQQINHHVELGRLLCNTCKELPNTKNARFPFSIFLLESYWEVKLVTSRVRPENNVENCTSRKFQVYPHVLVSYFFYPTILSQCNNNPLFTIPCRDDKQLAQKRPILRRDNQHRRFRI